MSYTYFLGKGIPQNNQLIKIFDFRFRCYSESNVSEMGSSGQLSLGISEASISGIHHCFYLYTRSRKL